MFGLFVRLGSVYFLSSCGVYLAGNGLMTFSITSDVEIELKCEGTLLTPI